MGEDICPYVFCPRCKSSNSWVRDETKDVIGQDGGSILWRGWRCKNCGDIALEPAKLVMSNMGDNR